jgi:phosphatidylglycerophosphatase A
MSPIAVCQDEMRMSTKTEASGPNRVEPASATHPSAVRKPRVAIFLATAGGLGYIPFAPGTWGSFAGALLYGLTCFLLPLAAKSRASLSAGAAWAAATALPVALIIALTGVWVSRRAASHSGQKDPQFVVIDEVSGQFFTYLLALAPLNWKYLLLGLILFRVFDIWKPFPARQAESLPGGWGIMADDWMAGVYAAIGLWIARAAGL